MKILLVYPNMPDTFYAMKHFLDVIGKKATYPPLGLLTIASMLPDEWDKKLVDLNIAELTEQDLKWADYVLLSAMNVQEGSVREIIQQCQSVGVPIIAGGPLFTHEYERFPGIDHFILNEGEITLPMFLKDLETGNPQHIYQSEAYADVHTTPLPAFHLADMKSYVYAVVQYSRGCPYMCDFCDVTALFGRRPRTKTVEQMIAELERIQELGEVQLVLFADDNLIGNKRILKSELLPALIEWRKKAKPHFYFATQLTINLVDDDELMQLLIDAGFRHVFIGIETPDEQSLGVSRKTQNLRRNMLENIYRIHQKGFIISGGFIVGFDTDTETIFERQVRFIQDSGIPLPIVNILKAPPGTELFDRMKKEGRLTKDFAFSEGDTNVAPVMGERELYEGFLRLIEEIYSPQGSYDRLIQFFETSRLPKTAIKIPPKYSFGDAWMFIRAIYLLGIKDQNRKYFWKLIFWTFRNNRKLMDKSLFYGVMIYQMHQTCQTIRRDVERNLDELESKKPISILA